LTQEDPVVREGRRAGHTGVNYPLRLPVARKLEHPLSYYCESEQFLDS
jgi:hypothetical protein